MPSLYRVIDGTGAEVASGLSRRRAEQIYREIARTGDVKAKVAKALPMESCVVCYDLYPHLSATSRCPRCEAATETLRRIPITEFEKEHRAQ